jgi:UDP-N-acetylmuramoylalanine--D-glutamate ligase
VYGATAPKLVQVLEQAARTAPGPSTTRVVQCAELAHALHQAVSLSVPGDIVLLSPACASYDQFPHYEARGTYFRNLVEALPAQAARPGVDPGIA